MKKIIYIFQLLIWISFSKNLVAQFSPFTPYSEIDSTWSVNSDSKSENYLNVKKLRFNRDNSSFKKLSKYKNVEILDLSFNDLQKLPNELFILSNLKALDLSFNHLTSLPDEMVKLQNLEILIIGENLFREIPEILTKLPKLKCLHILLSKELINPENDLKTISKIITLEELRFVGFGKCELNKIPTEIIKLKNLKYLHIDALHLVEIPVCIAELELLEELYFGSPMIFRGYKLFLTFPKELCYLPNLKTLFMSDISISNYPIEIKNLKKLKNLNMIIDDKFEITNKSLSALYLNSLVIEFDSKYKRNYLPDFIFEINTLKSLWLMSNDSLTHFSEKIGELSNLESLYLRNNSISEFPESFCNLKKLKKLIFFGNHKLRSIPDCINTFENLNYLDIGKCELEIPFNLKNKEKYVFLNLSIIYSVNNRKELNDSEFYWSLNNY